MPTEIFKSSRTNAPHSPQYGKPKPNDRTDGRGITDGPNYTLSANPERQREPHTKNLKGLLSGNATFSKFNPHSGVKTRGRTQKGYTTYSGENFRNFKLTANARELHHQMKRTYDGEDITKTKIPSSLRKPRPTAKADSASSPTGAPQLTEGLPVQATPLPDSHSPSGSPSPYASLMSPCSRFSYMTIQPETLQLLDNAGCPSPLNKEGHKTVPGCATWVHKKEPRHEVEHQDWPAGVHLLKRPQSTSILRANQMRKNRGFFDDTAIEGRRHFDPEDEKPHPAEMWHETGKPLPPTRQRNPHKAKRTYDWSKKTRETFITLSHINAPPPASLTGKRQFPNRIGLH
uniref:Uncharacterized protein n=1 Tax=Chromera velia CCMP2878 TaxID=1169474 RepID=A0A0G4FC16_9ALVE|mmetsp:Transcript_42541/g.83871  ORF Transcript_42541/g.83871 Transcript_42541/m.83871 type:complete len:345 (-) Transcript_42541:1089-2123(-)|eukprot:Cvel_16110.t1-p1 / transcript=Cvel_16110.t1 / gene=Cvel_16110 / organism=Chromera_velia_CCMP2878 / gene_product=hypothetical protein / transcript_product=hypothetical protein / location=Cvel_scaffold1226:16078-20207(+) / protein_length=344 / sequence_SO=supercontig / SO=protein_coding / is_pseudo=false